MINIVISEKEFTLRKYMNLNFNRWDMRIETIYVLRDSPSLQNKILLTLKNYLLFIIFSIESFFLRISKNSISLIYEKKADLNNEILIQITYIDESELISILSFKKKLLFFGCEDLCNVYKNNLYVGCYFLSFGPYVNTGLYNPLLSVLNKNRKTSFTLSKFTGLEKNIGLSRNFSFRTKPVLFLNLLSLELRLRHYTNLFILDELKPFTLYDSTKYNNTIELEPGFYRFLLYPSLHYLYIFYHFFLKNIFLKRNKWTIGFKYFDDIESHQIKDLNIMPVKKNQFLADPFIYEYNNTHYVFLESFHTNNKRGTIEVYKINGRSMDFVGEALNENFHLSFPFLFNHQGHIYMIPETSEINEVRIYKCVNFPLDWQHVSTPLTNISAADSIILNNDDCWYILTNVDTFKIGDHCSELHIFSSKDLFSSEWKPNKLNPIVTNPDFARNGGLLFCKDEILRVSQTHSFLEYGAGRSISKINLISDFNYNESLISKYLAKEDGFTGSHHMSINKDYFLTDLKK